MFGISLHRWFSPSTLTANIAIQVGFGSLLFMLAIQLTMALYLLYNSGVRPMYHQRWHRKIRNQVRLSAVYALIVVLSGIFQASLNKQLEAEIYEIGQMQLKQGERSVVEGEILEVVHTKNKQAYRYTIRVYKVESLESELAFEKQLVRPIKIWAYSTQSEIGKNKGEPMKSMRSLLAEKEKGIEPVVWLDQLPFVSQGRELLNFKGLFLVEAFDRQERLNPGDFDQQAYLKTNDIQLQATLMGAWLDDSRSANTFGIREIRAQGIRNFINGSNRIKHKELLAGIIWGYKHEIPSHHRELFAKLGLSHIMAVSGLHVGFVAAPFFFLLRRINRRPPYASSRRKFFGFTKAWESKKRSKAKKGASFGGIIVIKIFFFGVFVGVMFLYASFTGGSISVNRATMMAVCYVGTSLFIQQANPINSMAWSALLLLLWDQEQLFAPGFQLSYLAVSFLLLVYPKLEGLLKKKLGSLKNSPNLFRRLISRLLAAVGTSFFISLTLQLALLPLQLTYFDVVSIIGAWVNAFFLPLLSLCLPLAMIGSYVGLIWPNQPLSTLFMHPLDELFDLAFRWGTFLVAWPYSWVELQSTLSGSWILLVAICISSLYAVLVIWSNWIKQKSVDRLVKNRFFARLSITDSTSGRRKNDSFAWSNSPLSITMTMVLIVGVVTLITYQSSSKNPPLRVIFMHVGQGDASLVLLPNGKSVLVDSGPAWYGGRSNSRSIISTLDELNIDAIDVLIHTHPHADHIGSSKRLIEEGRIRQIAHSGYPYSSNTHISWLETARRMDVPVLLLAQGETLNLDPAVLIRILSPSSGVHSFSANNSSITVHIQYEETAALLMGDAEFELESRLIAMYDSTLAAQIIKIGHHGSKTSSSSRLLRLVNPAYAVISAGLNNRYSHPSPEVFDRLQKYNIPHWDLREREALFLESDGNEWIHYDWKYRKKRNKIPINSLDKAHENGIFQD